MSKYRTVTCTNEGCLEYNQHYSARITVDATLQDTRCTECGAIMKDARFLPLKYVDTNEASKQMVAAHHKKSLQQEANGGAYDEAPAKLHSILAEASKIAGAGAERSRDYGHPHTNHQKIAIFWNEIIAENLRTNTPISPRQVALMMIALKLAREVQTPKRDNIVDIAGYAECIGDIDELVARGKNGV